MGSFKPMPRDEFKRFLIVAYDMDPLRHGLFWDITGNGGFYLSQVLALTKEKLDYENQLIYITIMKQKNEVVARVKMPEGTMVLARKILSLLIIEPDERIWVFDSPDKNPSRHCPHTWSQFKKICSNAGLSSEYTPRSLRLSYGKIVGNFYKGCIKKIAEKMRCNPASCSSCRRCTE